MPTDISHRFDDESKYEWCEMMKWVEEVFGSIYAVASVVITNSAVAEGDKLMHITYWVSNLEVSVMTLIFKSPKLSAEKALEKQKAEVCHKIALMVATQVLELVKVGYPAVTRQNIQSLQGGEDNVLLQTIMQLVRDVTWPIIEPAVAREKTVLAPTVTAMDAQGRATTERETVLKKKMKFRLTYCRGRNGLNWRPHNPTIIVPSFCWRRLSVSFTAHSWRILLPFLW